MRTADALQVKRFVMVQVVLGSLAVVIAFAFGGSAAVSVMAGAGACLLANSLFAALVFRGYRAQESNALLLRIYGAEIAKLGLLLGLFGLAYVTIAGLNVPALLGAYLVIQIASNLIAAQWGGRSESRPANRI